MRIMEYHERVERVGHADDRRAFARCVSSGWVASAPAEVRLIGAEKRHVEAVPSEGRS